MFFKGYIELKKGEKEPIKSFKNKSAAELLTIKEARQLGDYAGILAPSTVLIDIDDADTSELLFKIVKDRALCCRVYQTTRGKHFLFRNPGPADNPGVKSCGTKKVLAIGILSDIKVGISNSYEVLKIDGEEREIIYDTTENEEPAELPRWLFPVDVRKNSATMDFLKLKDGDGRNQSLFNYILKLQSNDFSIEETRETIRIINQYVLQDPLEEKELETILRDDAFKQPIFYDGTKFLHDKFGTFMKNNAHIIKINDQLHIYKNGVYTAKNGEIEHKMIQYIPSLKAAARTEVYRFLNVSIMENTIPEAANMIAFENGLYNILDDSFVPLTPEHIVTNKIRWKYEPGAYSKTVDQVLDNISCHDPEIRRLLEEVIGYCFYRRNDLGKAFILTGDKSNGKSTFLYMIQILLGDENISSLDLKELGERFKTAEMFGKLANIGDDIGEEFIPNPSIFKKLVTGERISAERKGKDPFEFNNYSKLLFSANSIPRIRDKTGAVQRRLVIIPFDAKFTADTPGFDPGIKYKLRTDEAMSYLINLGLAALKRILNQQQFSTSKKVEKALSEYEETNNPVLGFFKECELEGFQIENEPTNKVYEHYQEYCILNSLNPMSNIEFSKRVHSSLGMKVVDKKIKGKKYRIFVREGT